VPGIHEFHCGEVGIDVDGRDKPGHDEAMDLEAPTPDRKAVVLSPRG
jgi:hypothetical protein